MTIALVLGGGAPNLTLMAGAVAALDDAGVEFDVVSTSGAGMLIGLLYAAPTRRGGDIKRDRAAALKNTVNMGVHDAIYRFFPVNFKVFHKPGTLAQAYTKFWQIAADNRFWARSLNRFFQRAFPLLRLRVLSSSQCRVRYAKFAMLQTSEPHAVKGVALNFLCLRSANWTRRHRNSTPL
jgi:predicted acylesterase/phospholipase RssA